MSIVTNAIIAVLLLYAALVVGTILRWIIESVLGTLLPYQCRNCNRPALTHSTYCPRCNYATIEPHPDTGGEHDAE